MWLVGSLSVHSQGEVLLCARLSSLCVQCVRARESRVHAFCVIAGLQRQRGAERGAARSLGRESREPTVLLERERHRGPVS